MSGPDQDPKIAAAFSALRREEEEQCPAYIRVRQRIPTRSRNKVHRRSFVAVAAAVGIAMIVIAAWIGLRTERLREPIPSIAEWRSPTGFLLVTPGREVLAAPAGLDHSVLDLATPTERKSPS